MAIIITGTITSALAITDNNLQGQPFEVLQYAIYDLQNKINGEKIQPTQSQNLIGLQQAFALNAIISPGSHFAGDNTLYALKINPSVTGTIAHIVVNFPLAYSTTGARVFNIQNIGTGHLSFPNSTSLSYDVSSPALINAGTQIVILLGNINNPNSPVSAPATFATKDGSNVLLESGSSPLVVQNVLTGSNFQLNFGNTEFGSHPCSVTITNTPTSYLAKAGIKISVISYLNGKTSYGQLAYAQASAPFLGEVMLFPYNFVPKGWLHADGALLPISQNAALFNLIGTTFGGDGITNFAIPDLRCMEPPSMEYAISLQGVFPTPT
jgi:hypothetical protein